MKFLRAILAATALALASISAHAQAIQIPPAKACFQATTGVSGMVGVLGTLTAGTGGTPGTYVVPLTGGSGTGATAAITNAGAGVTSVAIQTPGTAYQVGDILSADPSTDGGVTGFTIPVASVSINSSLAGGTVGFYIPNTLTAKQTWKDAAQATLNTNPVTLDQNGCASIYGSGTYRQIVKDSLGNTVWDLPTTGASTLPGGTSGGSANAQTLGVGFSALDGAMVSFTAGFTNTDATTLTPSGSSPIPIQKDTFAGPAPLTGGEIVAGNLVTLTYSASGGFFHLNAYPQPSPIIPRPQVRQTVSSGPAGPVGIPTFLAATSTTLTPVLQNISTAAPLIATAAGGTSSTLGSVDYLYQYTSNPALPSCSVNSQCYIFENAQTGVFVLATTVPIYQCGGSLSSTTGQFTFDYCGGGTGGTGTNAGDPMVGYVGNGMSAVATPLVALGECAAGTSALSGCIAYAYNGYYDTGYSGTLPGQAAQLKILHNLGTPDGVAQLTAQNLVAENGYTTGQIWTTLNANNPFPTLASAIPDRLSVTYRAGSQATGWFGVSASTGSQVNFTASSWAPRVVVKRGW